MRTLTALMLFALATPAMAFTGNDYLRHKADNTGWAQGYVEGYLTGIVRGYKSFGAVGVCSDFPDGVEIEQLVRVVEKALADNPQQTHLPLEVFVLMTFRETWGTIPMEDGSSCKF